jgi:hypothetical protein
MAHMETKDNSLVIARDIHSDMYKDVHGVRPRFTQHWTLEQLEGDMLVLQEEINEQLSDELCAGDSYHYHEDDDETGGWWEY